MQYSEKVLRKLRVYSLHIMHPLLSCIGMSPWKINVLGQSILKEKGRKKQNDKKTKRHSIKENRRY